MALSEDLMNRLADTQRRLQDRSLALSHPDQDHDMALVMVALHLLIEAELARSTEIGNG
ncbi:hypothetical protein IWQ55_006589 [Labrenzia sp. EL_208]|nr:hypothetical protein [Labrenzia sp. EL_132]MBG6233347.1 hypothetical protein [Labrenzia sp. EL_208]